MELPLEISKKRNISLRPVKEGFRIKEGQYYQCSYKYIFYITDVREELLKKEIIIQGYRIFDEEEILGFLIIADKPENKFKDFVYQEEVNMIGR